MWNPDIGYCLLCVWNDLHQIKIIFNFYFFLILFLFYKNKTPSSPDPASIWVFGMYKLNYLFYFYNDEYNFHYSRLFAY